MSSKPIPFLNHSAAFRPTLTGKLRSNVLADRCCPLLEQIASVFCGFIKEFPTEESMGLSGCCRFACELERVVQKAKQLEVEGGAAEWLPALPDAFERFSNILEKKAAVWVKELVDQKGSDSAWNFVHSVGTSQHGQLPGCIKPFLTVLSQASFMEKLEVPSAESGEAAEIVKRMKNYITLRSMKPESLQTLYPNQHETVSDYVAKVQQNIHKVSAKLMGMCQNMEPKLEKLRLECNEMS